MLKCAHLYQEGNDEISAISMYSSAYYVHKSQLAAYHIGMILDSENISKNWLMKATDGYDPKSSDLSPELKRDADRMLKIVYGVTMTRI